MPYIFVSNSFGISCRSLSYARPFSGPKACRPQALVVQPVAGITSPTYGLPRHNGITCGDHIISYLLLNISSASKTTISLHGKIGVIHSSPIAHRKRHNDCLMVREVFSEFPCGPWKEAKAHKRQIYHRAGFSPSGCASPSIIHQLHQKCMYVCMHVVEMDYSIGTF